MNTDDCPKYLIDRIEQAKKRVYAWPEIDELIKNENILARQFAFGNLGKKRLGKNLKQIQSKLPSLIVTSLPELEMVLRYVGVIDDIRKETLGNLQLKAEQSEKEGFRTRFSIWFYKSVSGNLSAFCGVQVDLKQKFNRK
jgi:hypothetical protein